MRCMACGAEMVLMNAVRDDTMAVAGFEHHTLQCPSCNDIERRLVFNPESAAKAAEPAQVDVAPPVSPAPPAEANEPATANEPASAPAPTVSAWRRAVAMFRGRHAG
jgi:hypothetical protein